MFAAFAPAVVGKTPAVVHEHAGWSMLMGHGGTTVP